jgi:hypothetical protein
MNKIYVEDYCNLGVTRPQRVGDRPRFIAATTDNKSSNNASDP